MTVTLPFAATAAHDETTGLWECVADFGTVDLPGPLTGVGESLREAREHLARIINEEIGSTLDAAGVDSIRLYTTTRKTFARLGLGAS